MYMHIYIYVCIYIYVIGKTCMHTKSYKLSQVNSAFYTQKTRQFPSTLTSVDVPRRVPRRIPELVPVELGFYR